MLHFGLEVELLLCFFYFQISFSAPDRSSLFLDLNYLLYRIVNSTDTFWSLLLSLPLFVWLSKLSKFLQFYRTSRKFSFHELVKKNFLLCHLFFKGIMETYVDMLATGEKPCSQRIRTQDWPSQNAEFGFQFQHKTSLRKWSQLIILMIPLWKKQNNNGIT